MSCTGKVLPDSKSIESCEIKEKDFLVLMVSKVDLAQPHRPYLTNLTLLVRSLSPSLLQ